MPQPFVIVSFYAGFLGLVLVWLSWTVIVWRKRTGIWLGDGGHEALQRAMRGQANFVETVPLTLVMLVLMAHLGAPAVALHLFGLTLSTGRLLHGLHFAAPGRARWLRAWGATLSLATTLAVAIGLFVHAALRMF